VQRLERLASADATCAVPANTTAWWADLLGANAAQLAAVGTPWQPIALRGPDLLEIRGRRGYALGAGGAAILSLAGGTVFAVQAAATNRAIDGLRNEIATYGMVISRSAAEVLALVDEAN